RPPYAAPCTLDVGISQSTPQRKRNGICRTVSLSFYGDHYIQIGPVYSAGHDRIWTPAIYRDPYGRSTHWPPQPRQSRLGIWPVGLCIQQSQNAHLAPREGTSTGTSLRDELWFIAQCLGLPIRHGLRSLRWT